MWRRTQTAGCEGQIDDVGRDSVIMGELSCVVSVNVTVSFISSSNIRRLRDMRRDMRRLKGRCIARKRETKHGTEERGLRSRRSTMTSDPGNSALSMFVVDFLYNSE